MAFVRFPNVVPQVAAWELRSTSNRFRSPLNGVSRTLERAHVWACRFEYPVLTGEDAARMKAFLVSARGGASRFYVRDFADSRRGSFVDVQLVTNPDCDVDDLNAGSSAEKDIIDGMTRIRALNIVSGKGFRPNYDLAPTSGQVIVARYQCLIEPRFGGSRLYLCPTASTSDASYGLSNQAVENVRMSLPMVAAGSSLYIYFSLTNMLDYMAEMYVTHLSASRGALIDVLENRLTYSEGFDNAAWTKSNLTVSPNTGEMGNLAAADSLIEASDAGGVERYISQTNAKPSAQEEMATLSVWVRRAVGTRDVRLRMLGSSSTEGVSGYFDLNAGTAAAPTVFGSFIQPRATIVAAPAVDDTGWYRISISAITDAHTSIQCVVNMVSGGSTTYAGDGVSSIELYGAQLQFSALPGRYQKTSATAVLASDAVNEGVLYLKGLPADTDELLSTGDVFEAVLVPSDGVTDERAQLCRLSRPMSTDVYGIAQAHVEPAPRWVPSVATRYSETAGSEGHRIEPHAAFWRPQARMMLDANSVEWTDTPGGFSSLAFTCVEAVAG